ncbi:MAG: Uma2 family endonuclease [Cyanobacteria bacterium P01_C01_bin.120]
MIQTIDVQRSLTFSEFLSYDFPDEGRYELVNGDIVRILATRQHDNIAEFIADAFKAEVRRLSLSYRVSGRVMIRTLSSEGQEQGRVPDVSVVDRALWDSNLSAYTAFTEPLQVAVEVVSTNWEDDYIDKLDEYQRLGIPEFWIVDYLAMGSRDLLGKPKVPTVFVGRLNAENLYDLTPYQGDQIIQSPTFSELSLSMSQILAA